MTLQHRDFGSQGLSAALEWPFGVQNQIIAREHVFLKRIEIRKFAFWKESLVDSFRDYIKDTLMSASLSE